MMVDGSGAVVPRAMGGLLFLAALATALHPVIGPAARVAAQTLPDTASTLAPVDAGGGPLPRPGDLRPGEAPAPIPVPRKPPVHQFRVGAGVAAFAWDEDAGAEDGILAGLDVERDLLPFLAARAGLAYGGTEFEGADGAGALDARLFLAEVSLLLQGAVGALRDGPLVPYAILGVGSLITDPDLENVGSRSQNAFGYGAGVRLQMSGRFGLRGEVRRYLIKLEDPLDDPATRPSESIHNTRAGGSLTFAF